MFFPFCLKCSEVRDSGLSVFFAAGFSLLATGQEAGNQLPAASRQPPVAITFILNVDPLK
jgi:hypothetical protein